MSTKTYVVKSRFGTGVNERFLINGVFKSKKKADALLERIKKDVEKLQKLYDSLDFDDYDVRHKYAQLESFFTSPSDSYRDSEIEMLITGKHYSSYYRTFAKPLKQRG